MDLTIPGGKMKGLPIAEVGDNDIVYWTKRKLEELRAEPDSRFADANRRWVEGAKAELASRGFDLAELDQPSEQPQERRAPAPAPERRAPAAAASPRPTQAAPRPSNALARASETTLAAMHDPAAINAKLEDFAASSHLVTPATSCAAIPDGFSVAFSMIKVDVSKDTAEFGGKFMLLGHVVKQIAAAAGVSWIPEQSGRLDDGSDPHYCHFRAVGLVTNFDGSKRVVTGEVDMDLRDGSPQVEALTERARKKNRDASDQIREMRLFILRHAETKAKLRAIVDMGLRRSYTDRELSKPFVVARLMWTGQSDDPELRRMYAEKMADAQMAGVMGLYGSAAALPRRAPAPQRPQLAHVGQFAGHAPPPVGALTSGDDLGDDDIPY